MSNHINYPNEGGRIYCRAQNKIITLDEDGLFWASCTRCQLFAGSYQGMGVECEWEDTDDNSRYVTDPNRELLRVSRAIDDGNLSKY